MKVIYSVQLCRAGPHHSWPEMEQFMDVLPVKYSWARKVTSFLLALLFHTFLSPQSCHLLCHIFTGAEIEPQPGEIGREGKVLLVVELSRIQCGNCTTLPFPSLHSIRCGYCHRDALVLGPLVLLQQRVPLTGLSLMHSLLWIWGDQIFRACSGPSGGFSPHPQPHLPF